MVAALISLWRAMKSSTRFKTISIALHRAIYAEFADLLRFVPSKQHFSCNQQLFLSSG
jgi:hypothetical protein